MNSFSPDMLLQRALDLRLRLLAGGAVEITVRDDEVIRCGAHTLAVLDAFARPTTFRAALDRLTARATGPADWAVLVETIRMLVRGHALIGPFEHAPKVLVGAPAFNGAPIHIRMLNDRVRTSRLFAAIRAVVQPGDVVVEVGTGTGVLAVAAAKAGAQHVYAIESGAMAAPAREMVRANGAADRVTVIEGWSSAVTLPERGDVFLSETIGNGAFEENLIAIARDALQRHLKPGARMIPRGLRLNALPVQASAEWLSQRRFLPAVTAEWQEWYGLDFSCLATLAPDFGAQAAQAKPAKAQWPAVGGALPLAQATFGGDIESKMEAVNVFTATGDCELNALVGYFESELAPGVELSSDPRQPQEDAPTSWRNPVWLVPPISLRAGDRVRVEFAWNDRGPHRWSVNKLPRNDEKS